MLLLSIIATPHEIITNKFVSVIYILRLVVQRNGGLTPNESERRYRNTYKSVTNS